MFEQTQPEFHAQHAPDSLVHGGLRNFPGAHQLRQIFVVKAAGHVHVNTAEKGFACGRRTIIGDSVWDEFGDRGPIAVHKPLESPLLPQNLFQGERIRGGWYPVQRIKRTHERGSARVDGRLKWR